MKTGKLAAIAIAVATMAGPAHADGHSTGWTLDSHKPFARNAVSEIGYGLYNHAGDANYAVRCEDGKLTAYAAMQGADIKSALERPKRPRDVSAVLRIGDVERKERLGFDRANDMFYSLKNATAAELYSAFAAGTPVTITLRDGRTVNLTPSPAPADQLDRFERACGLKSASVFD